MEKRYAIVRVEHLCPIIEEHRGDPSCPQYKDKTFWCSDCRMIKNYGDTKEQLINKVTQRMRQVLRKKKTTYTFVAKEIVEFLGVEK